MSEWNVNPVSYGILMMGVGLAGIFAAFFAGQPAVGAILFGLAGFAIAVHVYEMKTGTEKMAALTGESCAEVITSKHARFLGVPLELLGAAYYTFIVLGYLIVLMYGIMLPTWFSYILLLVSAFAVLFSIYLAYIQAIPLKKGCIWCAGSALLCFLLMAAALIWVGEDLIRVLAQHSMMSHTAYMMAIAIGLGTAVTNDVLTIKFLHDLEISDMQVDVLKVLQEIMWTVLGVIVIMAVFWITPAYATLIIRSEVVVSLIALFTIIFNESILYFYVSESAVKQWFSEDEGTEERKRIETRRALFALSSISVISWATMFILIFAVEATYGLTYSLGTLLFTYLTAIILAAVAGLMLDELLQLSKRGELGSYLSFDLG